MIRNFTYMVKVLKTSGALIDVVEADLLLVGIAARHYLLIFVLPDKLSFTKLLEVLIVVPELEVFRLGLETGHLVENAHICSAFFWTELLLYLFQQSLLFLRQIIRVLNVSFKLG